MFLIIFFIQVTRKDNPLNTDNKIDESKILIQLFICFLVSAYSSFYQNLITFGSK